MIRTAVILFVFCLLPILGRADSHVPLARAMDAMKSGDWTDALSIARAHSPVAQDLIEWHRLRSGLGSAEEVMLFLELNPDWPGIKWLRRKSEAAFLTAKPEDTLAFFKQELPQSAQGALAHARALKAGGQTSTAEAGIILAWRSMAIGPQTHAKMLADYGTLLKPHHAARLDMVLWEGWDENTSRMLDLVDDTQKTLATARIALRNRTDAANAAVQAVPLNLRKTPGLSYERFVWRARKGLEAEAIALALEASKSPKTLGEPERWSNRRRSLSRGLMRAKDYARAYALASSHHLSEGSAFADLEWLSGYLSLQYLKEPKRALAHFEAFQKAVVTPISLGRAGYWIGRAHLALGDKVAAQRAFAMGANYQSSFYGLLAAEAGGLPFDTALGGRINLPDWREADFMQSTVFQAAVLALQAGELALAERFFTHLTESLSEIEAGQLGQLAIDLNEPHLAVMIGKRAASGGITIPAAYYPLHDLITKDYPISLEFALAISRRESEFDPVVVSGAGARGLMQLMPRTAKAVSKELGIDYSEDKLTTDWAYNAQLGTKYLAGLDSQFGSNPIMMSAAYNAGPSRPVNWMKLFGDPRKNEIEIVDWIEHIPFRETRNYVMRVSESLPIYRARLGKDPLPMPFSKELIR